MVSTEVRILFVLPSLTGGGAERVVSYLQKSLATRGFSVSVVALYDAPSQSDDGVVALGHRSSFSGWRKVFWLSSVVGTLRRRLDSAAPDLVISFMSRTNVIAERAARPLGIPVILSERTWPDRPDLPLYWRQLIRASYRKAARVVGLSKSVTDRLDYLPPDRRMTIYNPFLGGLEASCDDTNLPTPRPFVCSVGRLVSIKRFDLLIRAFARVAKNRNDIDLVIWGDGNEREKLVALVASLSLESRVFLPGRTACPVKSIGAAELFVLTSAYEGLGNVLVEAMSAGTPVIAIDAPGGIREVLCDGSAGALLPRDTDPEALGDAILAILDDPDGKEAYAAAARAALGRFDPERVSDQWTETILNALQ